MITAITDLLVAGKRLAVRADLNVPMDATRFAEGMTPRLAQRAALVILSHFGRPKGAAMAFPLRHVCDDPTRALACPVALATLDKAHVAAEGLKPGQVHLVKNIRSTAGGAFPEWLEGRALPGIAALMRDGQAA